MSFWREVQRFLGVTPAPHVHASQPKVLLTQNCLDAIRVALDPEMRKGHEGIVYLLGRTDGDTALAVTVFKPEAVTSLGSFSVDARAMAACVGAAGRYELQIVGQLHSHPGEAYHSDGDVEGARIRYPGYVSIVLPNYGRLLPSIQGAAVYIWSADLRWRALSINDLIIIPNSGPWTSKAGTTRATIASSVIPTRIA
jgi:proteasome lid subunit RPN8/RPN11